jgi:hypothetical protein
MVRRGLNSSPYAPWPSVVLDSEGLWAVARNDVRAVLAASRNASVAVLVPAVVLAETLLGDERDARANQVGKRLVVVEITEPVARLAAKLKDLDEMHPRSLRRSTELALRVTGGGPGQLGLGEHRSPIETLL